MFNFFLYLNFTLLMRVYTDGCFDLFHYGHANALRQAKNCGDHLVVGVNSSESAKKYKNNPVMSDEERIHVVKSCKWADEIVPHAPYFLDFAMVKNLDCQLVVHGDDEIVDADGNHCYADAKSANIYNDFERTKGISTSEIVGRMLYKQNFKSKKSNFDEYHDQLIEKFMITPTSKKDKVVVYVDGSFDLYHAGHTSILQAAKETGDYLIVGLHNDNEIKKIKGEYPIMRTKERKLCLLSNKHIDEIIDDAPYVLDDDFIVDNQINLIFCGEESVHLYKHLTCDVKVIGFKNQFYYLNAKLICERIISNYMEYSKKVKKLN